MSEKQHNYANPDAEYALWYQVIGENGRGNSKKMFIFQKKDGEKRKHPKIDLLAKLCADEGFIDEELNLSNLTTLKEENKINKPIESLMTDSEKRSSEYGLPNCSLLMFSYFYQHYKSKKESDTQVLSV